jgi:hypothetical protein
MVWFRLVDGAILDIRRRSDSDLKYSIDNTRGSRDMRQGHGANLRLHMLVVVSLSSRVIVLQMCGPDSLWFRSDVTRAYRRKARPT